MKEKQEHHFKARLPQSVWDALEQMAQDEERSINWEIVQAVRERIARHKIGRKPREHENL
ncbi:Arc family DNA-binding protein [Ktedonobacter racemifer]|uniref:Arc family DNA-binding protein n=1 Tax=Ktedonobacter racemifer TaxID=363277 RepID=UPI0002EAB068|nr:Arc family DNA-binding protein [Ktedonobacter racemifer]